MEPHDPGDEQALPAEGSLGDLVIAAAIGLGVCLAAILLTEVTTGPVQWLIVVVGALAGLYGLYTLGVVAFVRLFQRLVDSLVEAPRHGVGEHRRTTWLSPVMLVVILLIDWALTVWVSGYDRVETAFTGLAVLLMCVATLAATFVRRSRGKRRG